MVKSRILTAAGVLALGLAAPAGAETLNIYNWSDYIGETTLEDFSAETGIDVNYDVYDSAEILEAKLLAGNSGYDIVVPTAMPFLARQIEAGVYQPLDRDKIPNLANLDPAMMERVAGADPGNAHAAIYQWGTNGIGYNVDMVAERMPDAPTGSMALIFDKDVVSKFADCGVSLLDSPVEVLPALLNYLGYDPNTEDPEALQAAEDRMMEIRPFIRKFHSSQYIEDLANGDICVAWGFSGDVIQAQARAVEAGNGVDIAYTIPEEGTIVWFDVLAIPADAPNPDAAHAFIDFVLRPEVMADITNYVAYGNAVPDSLEFVDEEIRTDPTIFPTDEVQARLFANTLVSPRFDRLRTRSWTRVRTGQ
ncbi:MAG: polyamine ABC transporter substrate-binding protein [Inquilinaceae bacterium]